MFHRKNFDQLRSSIAEYTTDNCNRIKAGVKHLLRYNIKRAAIILKGTFLQNEEDEMACMIDKFLQVYQLNETAVFSDATNQILKTGR